jgi:hypothetical protein
VAAAAPISANLQCVEKVSERSVGGSAAGNDARRRRRGPAVRVRMWTGVRERHRAQGQLGVEADKRPARGGGRSEGGGGVVLGGVEQVRGAAGLMSVLEPEHGVRGRLSRRAAGGGGWSMRRLRAI